MSKFLYLQNAFGGPPPVFKATGQSIHCVAQYETERLDWNRFGTVILSMNTDQTHLFEMREKIDAYIEAGGTLFFNGHVVKPFLPELDRFVPLVTPKLADLRIQRESEHPLFEGVTGEMLSFRKRVSGFYSRGSNPAPQGASVLNSIGPARWPVDWLYERPGGGRIYVHSGIETWNFFMLEGPQNLGHVKRIFQWFAETARLGT